MQFGPGDIGGLGKLDLSIDDLGMVIDTLNRGMDAFVELVGVDRRQVRFSSLSPRTSAMC